MTSEIEQRRPSWPDLPDFAGPARVALAVAVLGFAALGLRYGDFALQWQPAPEGLPGRQAWAYVSSILFGLLGMGLLASRLRLYAAWGLTALFLAWAVMPAPEMLTWVPVVC